MEAGKEKCKENWEMEEVGWKGEKEQEEAEEAASWKPGEEKEQHTQASAQGLLGQPRYPRG